MRAALRLADRELAELDARARHRPLAERLGSGAEVQLVESRHELVARVGLDVDDHQLLLGGGADAPVPYASARSATRRSWWPAIRPARGANPT